MDIEGLSVTVDERTYLEIDQGRRNTLVLQGDLQASRGEAITIRCEGAHNLSVLRAVQCVDRVPAVVGGLTVVGLEWVDVGSAPAVQRKVDEAMNCPNLRLELARDGRTARGAERRDILCALFTQIRLAVGAERFDALPAEALDQFAVMSLIKNQDTKGLLVSLLNSFLIAYLTPETTDRAYQCLESLEALRREIGQARRVQRPGLQ